MPKRLLTQFLHVDEQIANAADQWNIPEGDAIWTPQQDVLIVGLILSARVDEYQSDLAVAGSDNVEFVAQVTVASAQNRAGALAEINVCVTTTLQGAITNSGPTFVPSQNLYVAFPAPYRIPEGTDVGIFWYGRNTTSDPCTAHCHVIVQYVLEQGGNL